MKTNEMILQVFKEYDTFIPFCYKKSQFLKSTFDKINFPKGKKIVLESTKLRRILIVRLSSLGNVVQVLPVIEAIKEFLPHTEIDFLVEEANAAVLDGNPDLTNVFILYNNKWLEEGKNSFIEKFSRLIDNLKERDYDLVVNTHQLMKSKFVIDAIDPRNVIGLGKRKDKRPIHLTKEEQLLIDSFESTPKELRYEPFSQVVRLGINRTIFTLNIVRDYIRPRFTPRLKIYLNRSEKEAIVKKYPRIEDCIIVHPSCRKKSATWPVAYFLKVINTLKIPVVLTGVKSDTTICDYIERNSTYVEYNLCGKLNLRECLSVIANCRCVITNDTGISHVAVALQIPTFIIFGPTNPELAQPIGKHVYTFYYKACNYQPCYLPFCPFDIECIRSIKPKQVFQCVKKILSD